MIGTIFGTCCEAQTAAYGSGYLPVAPVPVAPGQILTVFVNLDLPTAQAGSVPLPASVEGTSVIIAPIAGVNAGKEITAPMFSVSPTPVLLTRTSGFNIAAVTVQIPYEIEVQSNPALPAFNNYSFAVFIPGSSSIGSAFMTLVAQSDAIHILRTGDTIVSPLWGLRPTVGPFPPVITHPDGSTVIPSNPAKPGETVSIWAVGLGLPSSGTVKTGEANPNPPLTTTVNVDFEFRSNAGPSMPSSTNTGGSHIPATKVPAYFAPGFVGLYQINVTIPTPPVPLESCGGVFQSNVTINVGGSASFDGAGICVAQ